MDRDRPQLIQGLEDRERNALLVLISSWNRLAKEEYEIIWLFNGVYKRQETLSSRVMALLAQILMQKNPAVIFVKYPPPAIFWKEARDLL